MDHLQIEQPKEMVTTVSAKCAHCGYVWDISRIVEVRNEEGQLVEVENVTASTKCQRCDPNPVSPEAAAEEAEAEEPVPNEPSNDEPVPNEPSNDEPVPSEPSNDEPVPSEPSNDEPVPNEPSNEEPSNGGS